MVLKESSQESPLTGETQTTGAVDVYNEEVILTGAILPVTREAPETGAGVAAYCVDTLGKLTALLLPRLTLVHIWKGDGQMREVGRRRER